MAERAARDDGHNEDAAAEDEGESFQPIEPEDDRGSSSDEESDSSDDDDGLEAEGDFDEAHDRRSKPPTAIQRDGRLARDTGEDEDEDDNVRSLRERSRCDVRRATMPTATQEGNFVLQTIEVQGRGAAL